MDSYRAESAVCDSKQPKLFDQARGIIRAKHYSIRTEEAYVQWMRRYILFHKKRHPSEMGAKEINEFLSGLAVERKVSASTQNQALCAILFLYKEVLHQEIGKIENLIWSKKPKKLPVVLTREEVGSILDHLSGTPWLMANLLYEAGLRVTECLRLPVKDMDFSYNQITVREGKRNKDRVTMLPIKTKEPLERHRVEIRRLHEKDLSEGFAEVYLPYAL